MGTRHCTEVVSQSRKCPWLRRPQEVSPRIVIMGNLLLFLFVMEGVVVHCAIDALTFANVSNINVKGPYLGLVIPNSFELRPLLSMPSFNLDADTSSIDISGRRFYVGEIEEQRVLLVMSGLGMLNAAITTQLLITYFDISGILHYGIAGNANDELNIGDITVPQYWAHTGIWNWERYSDSTTDNGRSSRFQETIVATLVVGDYNNPLNNGLNYLAKIENRVEEVYTTNGIPETKADYFWMPVDEVYYQIAQQITMKDLDLQYCTNASYCLSTKPRVVLVSKGASSNIYLDNAAYRSFLHETFDVSPVDMESASVALTCLTNNVPFVAFRALSDLAGGSNVSNEEPIFYDLAANNAIIVLTEFIKMLDEI